MGGIAAVIVALMVFIAWRGSHGPMAYLYTDLTPSSAAVVTERLSAEQIPYELADNGRAVMVPTERVAKLRMDLANEQVGGTLGYEILDRQDSFGMSASKARINKTRAIEGELARSIETITAVRRARVHINLPERALFETDSQAPTASVTLRTGGRIAPQQVAAIRALVAGAVPGLSPDAIALVDQSGTLLARAGDERGAFGIESRQIALEARLKQQVETLLGRIVGAGGVRAEVSAQLDMEDMREESETYDPDLAVLQRTTTVERSDENTETSALGGAVTVSNALPENDQAADQEARRSRGTEVSEEQVWANSSKRTTRIRQGGRIERLTVSVLVDGAYIEGPGGDVQYQARSQAELDRYARLVRNAIGFDAARGDSVVVENLRFVPPEGTEAPIAGLPLGLTRSDVVPMIRTVLLGLLGLAALVLVIRSLKGGGAARITQQLPSLAPESNEAKMKRLLERAANGDEEALAELQKLRGEIAPPVEQEIDLAQIEGRLKTSVLRKVGDVVEKSPRESSAIIRQWMYS